MQSFGIDRFLCTAGLVALSSFAVAAVPHSVSAQAQPQAQPQTQPLPSGPNQARPIDPSDPNVVRPSTNADTGILSQQAGQRLLQESNSAVTAQNYPQAIKKLQEARQIFNQLSNFYQDLAGSFSGIENRIADAHRRRALETAQLRDDATYRLALVHRAQNQPELAVPLLIQIIRSQQPTRDLGKKAYQQLFELGFVDSQFPRPRADAPTAPTTTPTSSSK